MKSIIYNAEMMRAWLDGRKSQTRRLMKPQPQPEITEIFEGPPDSGIFLAYVKQKYGQEYELKSPYLPGETVYIRETWTTRDPIWDDDKPEAFMVNHAVDPGMIIYRADGDQLKRVWRPSIHMPEWASRSHAIIESVRAERIQEITEEDAKAEGIINGGCLNCGESEPCGCNNPQPDARDSFIYLWENLSPGSWERNEWVWVYGLKKVEA